MIFIFLFFRKINKTLIKKNKIYKNVLMNIRRNRRNIKMNLEQALLKYGNDITYLVLRDGTNIEIIDDYQKKNLTKKIMDIIIIYIKK